jgi:aspartyl-tRNA(Asn)/glutamyl-tRNA(Gln) amidotransferase subunit A
MAPDPALMSLAEVAQAIADRRLSSVEATRAALDRIERWQAHLNCFIANDAEMALARAAMLDAELARGRRHGPLHGIPLAHKDMFYRSGAVCTGGSAIRRDWRASTTATVLDRLDSAGAIQLGTLNMSEFAAGATGHNKWYGDCRNPWNPAYMTGGSSSGSGAAVAARLAYGALGADTGGSIRIPAAANGVLGLKPTYGRVSRHGAMPRAWSLDHVGPLARTAEDCALLLSVIAGFDPKDSTSSHEAVPDYVGGLQVGIKGLRIGILSGPDEVHIDPEVQKALGASLEVLQALGAELTLIRAVDLARYFELAETIIKCEAAAMHQRWLRQRPQEYANHVRTRMEAGLVLPATRYIEALSLRGPWLADFLDTIMADIDVVHYPAIPIPVPTLAETDLETSGEAVLELFARISLFMRPFNFLGLPAISIPCGFTGNGLPVAFQAVGKPFTEAMLLTLAHAYQEATDHHRRVPSLDA